MQKRKMTKYPTLTVRLPQHTLDWVWEEAESLDVSNAEIIKRALNLYHRTKYHPTD
jgi:hypothetical protein